MPTDRQRDAAVAGAALLAVVALGKPLWKRWRLSRVPRHVLTGHGIEVEISSLGGILQRLRVVDAHGKLEDVVLGYDSLLSYLSSPHYFGAVVGRVCNRIAGGKLVVDGQEHQLARNNQPNHLHGGARGWDKVQWRSRRFRHHEGEAVELSYTSPDGEEGYPGTVEAKVTYILGAGASLRVIFEATTDKATPVSMTQHTYWNLGGHASGDVLGHRLQLVSSHYTPKDGTNIPTGEIAPVEGSAFDFSEPRRVGARIGETGEAGGGYDHNYVLFGMGRNAKFATVGGQASATPKLAAQLEDPKSGRVMRVLTTAPGCQLYTGNAIDGERGKRGAVYGRHAGLCLETQGFPNAANEPDFPSVLLAPGETYRHEVVYEFSVK